VAYYFPPSGGGGVQRMTKLIKYASRRDWTFTVLTANDFSISNARDQSLLAEIPSGVRVIRLAIPAIASHFKSTILSQFTASSSYWKRWISAFRYIPDIRRGWIEPARQAALNELKQAAYDCILVTSPPYSLTILAAQLQKETDTPVIVDFRDPWTSNPYKLHPTPYHLRKDRQIEFSVVRQIRHGVSAYQTLLEYYQQSIPEFLRANWTVIPNGFDENDFTDLQPVNQDERFFNLAFSGTFYSHINNPQRLFRAIGRVNNQRGQNRKICFHHIGQSFVNLPRLAKKYGLSDQLVSHGYLEHKACLSLLAGMDGVTFILDNSHRHGDKTIGGKVYEYLRLKKPILALVPQHGEAARLIHETNSGCVLQPDQAGRIEQTLDNWRQNPPQFPFCNIAQFSRERQAEKFVEWMNKTTWK
jgi:glycosyltransferase involved in cell wall biosynthesis